MSQRASSFLIGLCIGGAAACAWKLAAVVWGWPWGVEVAASLVLGGTFTAPALEWATDVLLDSRARWLNPQAAYAEGAYAGGDEAPSLNPAQPVYTPSPLIGGGLADEWEAHHVRGMEMTLQHAQAAGAFTSTVLVGVAFPDTESWGYWMGCLATSGIVDKTNGLPTALKANMTFTSARRKLRRGEFEIPVEYLGTPYPALPLAYPPERSSKGKL